MPPSAENGKKCLGLREILLATNCFISCWLAKKCFSGCSGRLEEASVRTGVIAEADTCRESSRLG